jgi:hypothetical protein
MARSTVVLVAWCVAAVVAQAATGFAQGAVPRPFPGSKPPMAGPPQPPPSKPSQPSPAKPAEPVPPAPGTPDAALAGIPQFPQAQFLDSFDAGQGQRYYLYGTNAPFEDVAAHFRATLMSGGRQVYRTPAVQQFDLGRFDDQRMAFPPSVVVKDYAAGPGGGYLFIRDGKEQRFRTIIQIVPPAATAR